MGGVPVHSPMIGIMLVALKSVLVDTLAAARKSRCMSGPNIIGSAAKRPCFCILRSVVISKRSPRQTAFAACSDRARSSSSHHSSSW